MNRFYSIFILVLLFNLYCYSFTLPCIDQSKKDILPLTDSNSQDVIKSLVNDKNNQDSYVNILCTLYGTCLNKDQQNILNGGLKPKRLMSSLFHGIPKFGKREFRSVSAGISKFG
ncbi:unnamed protein product [Rotaria magnacalcarata]|uniref:Uncharacterized protein n=1 Tax=Rotaria magnacalcarata TaxID=392030 RepID=A0A816SVF4_9BILA|nr:unnamed protein product [Rotaria magnacalcarata]CAF1600184.1 unnamed protein product [Rotaria magnacalcarata]CAF2091648.1 unnamed protein product [Rotaria magnacalcarata]CAF2128288.1 unnamed protein product [Rotaria magnacalcarata]CAF2134792.1 unnamed protein product [Rotaria magnacalcarata]